MEILLVDDDENFLEQEKRFLSRELESISLNTVNNPEKVLNELNENDFDCVVSDYQMPEMDGLELLETIREEYEDIPFIIFTGRGREEVAMEALNLGANHYLQKGGDPESQFKTLFHTIEREFQHKKSEEELKKAYKAIESSRDVIIHVNLDGKITYCNNSVKPVFGYEKEDLIDKPVSKLMPLDAKILSWKEAQKEVFGLEREEVVGEPVLKKLSHGMDMEPHEIVITFLEKYERDESPPIAVEGLRKDGSRFPIEWSVSTYENKDGEKVLIGTGRDIKEQTKYEKKLRKSKNNSEKLHEVVMGLQNCQTEEEVYELIIDTSDEILGFESSQIILNNLREREGSEVVLKVEEDFCRMGSRDDCEEGQMINEEVARKTIESQESFVDGKEVGIDIGSLSSDENLISIPISDFGVFQAVKEDGMYLKQDLQTAELLVSHSTEALIRIKTEKDLRESERKYSMITEDVNDMITLLDLNGNITFINDAHKRILGYEPEQYIGENFIEFIHPEDKLEVMSKFKDTIRGEREERGLEVKALHEDGETRWIESRPRIIRDEEGEPEKVLVVSNDITGRKESEERGEFLQSIMEHDLNRRIQIIEDYAEMASEEQETEILGKFLREINNSKKLLEKVQILKQAQNEEISGVNLRKVISQVIKDGKESLKKENIDIEYDEEEIEVLAGSLINKIFQNIIENSIEHAECNKIRIRTEETKNEEVLIRIEDDGKGIPPQIKDQIFEKSYKNNNNTGIGMSIIKKLIKTYNGEIEVKDSDMGGARFDLIFDKPEKKNK